MIHSKRSQEGYLLIDHRASPGVTSDDFANVNPYRRHEFIVPPEPKFEAPTLRCSHCGTFVILNPDRKRDRNYCSKCDHYVCDAAICVMECSPFARKIETAFKEAALLINLQEI